MNKQKRKIIASRMKLVERILSEVRPPSRPLYTKWEVSDIRDAYQTVGFMHPVRARNYVLQASRKKRMFMQREILWSVYRDLQEGIACGSHFDVKFNIAAIASGSQVLIAGSFDAFSPSLLRTRREYTKFLEARTDARRRDGQQTHNSVLSGLGRKGGYNALA